MKKILCFVVFSFTLYSFAALANKSDLSPQSEPQSNLELNQFLNESYKAQLLRSPMQQTWRGIRKSDDRWDDLTEAFQDKEIAIAKTDLVRLTGSFDYGALSEQDKLSYQLYKKQLEDKISRDRWRHHNYLVTHMSGWQSRIPSFLINAHTITTLENANTYIARVNAVLPLMEQVIAGMKLRKAKGILPPRFVYPYAIGIANNLIKGQPFDDGDSDSPLLEDFKSKIGRLELTKDEQELLLHKLDRALMVSFKPAYEMLIAELKKDESIADDRDGVWKLPDGDEFYQASLNRHTTTALTADEIHQLGLSEVARIHAEMRKVIKHVNFSGNLQDFFEYTRTDPQFYYPSDDLGRKAYLAATTQIIDAMRLSLDDVFIVKPKADLVLKPVEPFQEKTSGNAYYNGPAEDGSRPGIYYVNLYRMSEMPKYMMEAFAYHEAIPGHHMQIAIAQELTGIPEFRKYGHYTAYEEGWGLYSELLAKEMGFYKSLYSEFGRLAAELQRACRLVVDTGIHSKRWSRNQTIEYLVENTPNQRSDVIKSVDRYILGPGQATAYTIGKLRILKLREQAKTELEDRFDIREFHDVVLKNGPVPLSTLEKVVTSWITSKHRS